MVTWRGHRAGTRSALLDLLTTAQSGRIRFSEAQRALFTACEFWAAVQNSSLPEYLSEDIESYLQAAEAAFSAIGLPSVAVVLQTANARLSADSPAAIQQTIQELEAALLKINEPVDMALERFANRIEDI